MKESTTEFKKVFAYGLEFTYVPCSAKYLTLDKYGKIIGHTTKPTVCEGCWCSDEGMFTVAQGIDFLSVHYGNSLLEI